MFFYVEIRDSKIVSKGEVSQPFKLSVLYREVSGALYNSIGKIPCSFVEVDGEIVSIEYIEPFVDLIVELQNAKVAKIIELNTACNQTILNGFSSTCMGTEHQYKFDMEYQGNITQQGVMLTLDPTIETVIWPTSDAGVIPHTREQFIQLCKDAQNWKATNIYRYFELKAQVEACTVIADVEAFVW